MSDTISRAPLLDPEGRPVPLYRRDLEGARWVPVEGTGTQRAPSSLGVMTWNVWFGQRAWRERLDAIIDAIVSRPWVDVVALQELRVEVWYTLCHDPRVHESGFCVADVQGATLGTYGVGLLTRLRGEVTLHQMPTHQGRSLLRLRPQALPGLSIATAHLESMRPNQFERLEQIEQVTGILEADPRAVWMGDMNAPVGDEEDEAFEALGWRDQWASLYPSRSGETIDTERNTMLREVRRGRGPKRVRYDRIWSRGIDATRIEILGTEPIEDGVTFPSDHFGLAAEFSL